MAEPPLPNQIQLKKIPDFWENQKPLTNIQADIEDAWKKRIQFLDEVSLQNNVVVFIVNPYTSRYLYMSDKLKVLSGIDPALYTAENGMDFSFSRAHPEQLEAMIQINQMAVNTYRENDPKDFKNILLCINFLYRNANEEYIQVLQRTTALEYDAAGNPSLFISVGHYVGHIKKRDSLGLVISTPAGISMYDYDLNKKCIEEPKIFSEQEKKILLLLAGGKDSKTIAQKLAISPHTVDTHRRNLIKKTSCIDTTAVVSFAKLINLI